MPDNTGKELLLSSFTGVKAYDPSELPSRMRKRKSNQSKIVMSSKKAVKISKIFDTSSEKFVFKELVPMHELWKEYMKALISQEKVDPATLLAKVLKADFHGALISVFKAKNKCLVGVEGIVIKETQKAFYIVNAKDEQKTVLKKGMVFILRVPPEG